MKYKIIYRVEVDESVGMTYVGRETQKHFEEIDAEKDIKALGGADG